MSSAPVPPNEPGRLAALRRYEILDTEPEQNFDDLTLLASHVCGTPVAVISAGSTRYAGNAGFIDGNSPRS